MVAPGVWPDAVPTNQTPQRRNSGDYDDRHFRLVRRDHNRLEQRKHHRRLARVSPANTYAHGQDVATLQRDLGQLNYYETSVDGVYGPATTAAVKDFQRANCLAVDGIAGPTTMARSDSR
jgi:murein L,D-transpeptidase YcbB/YkuD